MYYVYVLMSYIMTTLSGILRTLMTRNKYHSNLNSITFYKTVTSQSPIYKCTLLCRKLNLNLFNFNIINSLKLYIKLNQFDNITLNYDLLIFSFLLFFCFIFYFSYLIILYYVVIRFLVYRLFTKCYMKLSFLSISF